MPETEKVGRKLSNKNWKRTKRFYPLSHNFNRHYTKLEKHTYGQMAFNTKPAVAQRDIREPPLISYRKEKSLKDMLVKAEL